MLAGMEEALGGFQSNLGAISTEIRSLQEQSVSLSVKLKNRKAAEAKLGELVEEIALPPELIDEILDAEVGDSYVDALQSLAKKLDFVSGSRKTDPRLAQAAAMDDVRPELEQLRVRAVQRLRDFLLGKFAQLKRPNTNIQILQQMLLKFRYFGNFLRRHGGESYPEVVEFYVSTMSGVLTGNFQTYIDALLALRGERIARGELLGAPEAEARRAAGGGAGGSGAAGDLFGKLTSALGGGGWAGLVGGAAGTAAAFAVGERGKMLREVEGAVVIPHIAGASGQHVLYEEAYRSIHKLLMDTTTSEYMFCNDFFGDKSIFNRLFAAPLASVEEGLNTMLPQLFDPVGLLIMVRLTHQQQLVMTRRRIPCLDSYFDKVVMLLYPRFTAAFDTQAGSLAQAAEKAMSMSEGRGRRGLVVQHPHFVVRRYAHFMASMAALSVGYADATLGSRCLRLRNVGDTFVERLSRAGGAAVREQAACMLANFDEVRLRLAEALRSPPRPAASSEDGGGGGGDVSQSDAAAGGGAPTALLRHYEEKVAAAQSAYVDAELAGELGELIGFVRAAESALSAGQQVDAERCAAAVDAFGSRWRASISTMRKASSLAFPRAERATEVLRACLAQMLLYYTRALDAAKRGGCDSAISPDAPTLPLITHEIKQSI